ncbi:MAG: carboxypeptidase regulatory-like domain-containing protein, partial [Terriglobia bacterium]
MKNTLLLATLAVLVLVAFTPSTLFGQAVNYAQIQGRIMDETGAVVPGAQIKVTQVATGLVRTTPSNDEGQYFLPNLPVGPYQLRVTMHGFRDYIQDGIVLQVGVTAQIDVKLQIGAVTAVVQVEADTGMVETRQNSISTVIDNSRIMELPLNGRNAPNLIMIAGAASNNSLPSQDLMSSKNYGNGTSGASQTISVAGGQQNANNYLLDGGDNNDAFSNVNSPFPFPDAIQEFSVQNNGLSARYGVHAGAVINVVTKSGTNNFHGNLFEFLRNPITNAQHEHFTPVAPGFKDDTMKRNQFGGTLGGPIKKDKLTFFVGYQGTRQASTPPPIATHVPTSAALAGDFSTMMSGACQSNGKAKTLKAPFVNNRINPSLYNAASLALAKYLPAAADPCGNVSFTIPGIVNEDMVVSKVDWNLSDKHTFFTRYLFTDFRAPVAFDASNILPQGQTASQL